MKDTLRIKTVMTPFPYSVDATQSLDEAVTVMKEHDIRHLPVRKDEELLGILSERELQLIIARAKSDSSQKEPLVGEVLSGPAHVVDLLTPVAEVVEEMALHRLGAVLVTKSGKLVGVFTATDACRCLADILREMEPEPEDPSRRKAVSI
ncbi:MAG: CBS domain-containing protein [Deltaproteobacteria bacterium]|nr:CBS domain-containing protein [Deltaproteobacteria bacterium]